MVVSGAILLTVLGVLMLVIIGSDIGLAPIWCEAIIWISDDFLPIGSEGQIQSILPSNL